MSSKPITNEMWSRTDWVEIPLSKHRWLSANREEVAEVDSPARWFVIKGTQWPLVCISVWKDYPMNPLGVRISVSVKGATDAWFHDCNLPPALVPILIEMLKAVSTEKEEKK